jgi:hypothetical protein
MAVVFTQFVHN